MWNRIKTKGDWKYWSLNVINESVFSTSLSFFVDAISDSITREKFTLYASHVKEGEIRRGWYCARRSSAGRERERGKEYVSVPRCARGDAWGKKKSMETSCSIGEVFPRLEPRTGVQSAKLLWQKATRSLRHFAPRRLVCTRCTGCPAAIASSSKHSAGILYF